MGRKTIYAQRFILKGSININKKNRYFPIASANK